MATLVPRPTILAWLRANKEDSFIQFLTWYLILVKEWRLEDIAAIEMSPFRPGEWGHMQATYCFLFHDGKRVSLEIVQNGGKFYVESSLRVGQ